ncbi:hypothetical protein [Virgibacillus kimchii]
MITKRWEAFCAYSIEECEEYFLEAIKEIGIETVTEQSSINSMQNFMLGSEGKVKKITFKQPYPFELKIISVSQDPLYRFFMSLFSSQEKELISLLSMEPLNKDTQPIIFNIMQAFFKRVHSQPWDIQHPRFKVSWLLNYRNKKKWNYWFS